MTRADLVNKIAIGLQDCRTANNISLSEHFTNDEIHDFANTLTHYLPESLNARFSELDEEVFNVLADKESFFSELLAKSVRNLYAGIVNRHDIKLDLIHLIMVSLVTLNDTYDLEPEQVLNDTINYYNTLKIDSDDLAKTVHEIPADTAVALFNDNGGYIRVDFDNIRFVPTLTTKQNFKYLIPKEWNL